MREYLSNWLARCYGLKVPSSITTLQALLDKSEHIRLVLSDSQFNLQNHLLIAYDRNELKSDIEGPITTWERSLKHAGCYVLRTTHSQREKWWCIKGSDEFYQPYVKDNPSDPEFDNPPVLPQFITVELEPSQVEDDIIDVIASGTQFADPARTFAAGVKYISSMLELPDADVPDEWYEDKNVAKREILESIDEIFAGLPQKRAKK